jgi:hypothetical protein
MKRGNGSLLFAVFVIISLLTMTMSSCSSQYSFSSSCSPVGAGQVTPSNGKYDKQLQVAITASPALGYRFDHWEGSGSGDSPTLHLLMDRNKKVTAFFTKVYMLSASSTPSDGGSVSPKSGTYDAGSNVSLIANPNQYYKFNGWAGDVSGNSDHITITMDSNKQVVASFVKLTYILQAQVDSTNTGTVQPSSGSFEAGTQRTITATPANGYRFDHWGGSATGTQNPINILMDTNKTITAYFTKVYTLTSSCSPTGSGSVSPGNGPFDAGTKQPVTATTTLFPYAFDHWSGTDNDAINPTTVTMIADKSVTVYFKKLSPGTQQTAGSQISGTTNAAKFQLTSGQWVQGEIKGFPFDVDAKIVDTSNNVIKDLGRISDAPFTFQALNSGTYTIIIYNSYSILFDNYTLTYTIYS